MQEYYSILTNKGMDLLLKAAANQAQVKLTKMAVSDDESPLEQSATELASIKHSFSINSLFVDENDPHQLIAEGVISADTGGFYITKAGIYTEDGELFAVSKLPKSYKPLLTQGSAKDITIKFIMQVDNANSVVLRVDDSVALATRNWVKSQYYKKEETYTKTQIDKKYKLAVPTGTIVAFASAIVPEGYLECNGAELSRTVYANLFNVIGTKYGAGNSSTTFNIPDLRGEFIRGWDHGRGADNGRAFGSTQGDAIRNIVGKVDSVYNAVYGSTGVFKAIAGSNMYGSTNGVGGRGFTLDLSNKVPTAHENRPRNVALMYCIKY